ncbi:MAG: hypothetical protein PVJ76_11765 [Gemmatimonadota bacterium]|jgi:hypothetical protein
MMRSAVATVVFLLVGSGLHGQAPIDLHTGLLFEKYDFDDGLAFSGVSQLSVPVTFSTGLGNRGELTLSSGLTKIDLTASETGGEADRSLSGIVDTEARVVLHLVPDRFSLLLTAVAPTGIEALEVEEGPILTALSSQVVGFSTTSLGTGGAGGAGFAAAFPAGEMAFGVSASYTQALAYAPVLGQDSEWKPGGELRIRAGLEGPVGTRSYLRVASVFAKRQKDQVDGIDQGSVGNRIHAYVALNTGVGSGTLTLYAFDSYRSAPQLEATPVGQAILPKGNLLALGGKAAIPIGRETRLMPRLEVRRLTEAPRDGAGDGSMDSAGSTIRLGADLRQPLSPRFALVLEANGLFGDVGDTEGGLVSVNGFRGGIHLEFRQ